MLSFLFAQSLCLFRTIIKYFLRPFAQFWITGIFDCVSSQDYSSFRPRDSLGTKDLPCLFNARWQWGFSELPLTICCHNATLKAVTSKRKLRVRTEMLSLGDGIFLVEAGTHQTQVKNHYCVLNLCPRGLLGKIPRMNLRREIKARKY